MQSARSFTNSVPRPRLILAAALLALSFIPALRAGPGLRYLVNTVPADARYVIYAQMNLSGLTIAEGDVPQVSANLSASLDGMPGFARPRGANLIVILTQAHGIPVPVRQVSQPLVLRRTDPVVTLLLFDWDPAKGLGAGERRVRFYAGNGPQPAPPTGTVLAPTSINMSITLKSAPDHENLATWAYLNLTRFVKEAAARGFDSIVIKSSGDPVADDVWLPGCDEPVRISGTRPELNVTAYRRK
jgi:hypothetical protein